MKKYEVRFEQGWTTKWEMFLYIRQLLIGFFVEILKVAKSNTKKKTVKPLFLLISIFESRIYRDSRHHQLKSLPLLTFQLHFATYKWLAWHIHFSFLAVQSHPDDVYGLFGKVDNFLNRNRIWIVNQLGWEMESKIDQLFPGRRLIPARFGRIAMSI